MSAEVQGLVASALSLPATDRIVLAEKILESLDDADQAEIDAAWAKEAEDRLEAFERGEIKATPW